MSADNGIYILETPVIGEAPNGELVEIVTEYRVAHLQAVENYAWDSAHGEETGDPDIQIANAREMWPKEPIFYTRAEALAEADRVYQKVMADIGILEYGISWVRISRSY